MSSAAHKPHPWRSACELGMLAILGLSSASCKGKPSQDGAAPAASASAEPGKLSPELAARVLAKVGGREITLGEYAATLERMDPFERLRYQTPDRRRKLLDEIINAELLAGEAKHRGLDKRPETEQRIRQALRDEVVARSRAQLPTPAEIPEAEVRKYYEDHRAEFQEPERRRVAHIVLSDETKAKKILEQALKASPGQWGKLVQDSSLDKPPTPGPTAPLELAGDLGIVSAPGEAHGENLAVPESVRAAVFKIPKLGGVHPELVPDAGKFHIVRLTGKTDARARSYVEAERAIRVTLLQLRAKKAEDDLERELRQRYPVKIDDAALQQVPVPKPSKSSDVPSSHAPP
jgi:peptidyl-prolyl cis-trans isomerase C